MRNRGGRWPILPLLALFSTFAAPLAIVRAAETTAPRPVDAPTGKGASPENGSATVPAAGALAPREAASTGTETAPTAPNPETTGDTGQPAGTPSGSAEVTPPRMVPSLSHDLQFGIAVLGGDGYRIIFPYTSQPTDCGDANNMGARVCTNRAPSFIDLQPSFGISQSWDFLVDLRLSIEKDFNTRRQVFIMPGFRYWLDTQSHLKFFTTIQIAYDASKQNTTAQSSTDFGIRNSNGLMVEIMRNFGVYAQFGETMGFVRWLSFSVDAGLGVQARVP